MKLETTIQVIFYHDKWSEDRYEFNAKFIPRIGESVILEDDSFPEIIVDHGTWIVQNITHAMSKKEHLITITLI